MNQVFSRSFWFSKDTILSLSIFFVLFIIGIITLGGFFRLGICCDEITLIFTAQSNSPSIQGLYALFTGPYGSQYLLMDLLYLVFKFNYSLYYGVAFFFRLLTAGSLYLLTAKLSKNKLIGFMTALWLMVSYAGLETTEAVNNSITYLSLSFLNIGLLYLYRYYVSLIKNLHSNFFVQAIILFFLAFATAPIRMHGLIFLYLFIEAILVISKKSPVKFVLMRIFLFIGMIYIISQIGFFRADGTAGVITKSPLFAILHLVVGFQKALILMCINFYEIIFPPSLLVYLNALNIISFTGFVIGFVVFEICVTILCVVKNKSKFFLVSYSAIFILELVFMYMTQHGLSQKLFTSTQAIDALFGMFLLANSLRISLVILKQNQTQGFVLLCSILFPFFFFLTYYAIDPNTYIEVTSRYMMVGAEGIYFFYIFLTYLLASIFFKKLKNDTLPSFIRPGYITIGFMIIIIANIYDARSFIAKREIFRSNIPMQKAFQVMNRELEKHQGGDSPLILLTTNSVRDNGDFMYWSITYGGVARFALQGSIPEQPTFVSSLSDVKKYLSEGNETINDVFAFTVKNKTVYPITDSVRQQLQK